MQLFEFVWSPEKAIISCIFMSYSSLFFLFSFSVVDVLLRTFSVYIDYSKSISSKVGRVVKKWTQ